MPTSSSSLTRRRFLSALTLAAAGSGLELAEAAPAQVASIFDPVMEAFVKERSMPAGALAVARKGRIVHARGYGWADRNRKKAATADSLFRVASLSKPITAVAVLQLVERNRLDLDWRPFEFLNLYRELPVGKKLDERWRQITLRHLLQHTGGWDRSESFDPMFRPRQIAQELGAPSPAGPWSVIRYMLGQPLDFDPGLRYAYSNFGYCLLGRVIEHVTGQRYETYVRQSLLGPIGISRARIGDSRRSAPGEVCYYMPSDQTAESVFHPHAKVPWPYGGFYLEAMDAHGGWIASATDLVRFASALGPTSGVLSPASIDRMSGRPSGAAGHDPEGTPLDAYYGCGWRVRPVEAGRANYWHMGSLPGTFTLLVRRHDDLCYAALFNQRSTERSEDPRIDPQLYRAADQYEQNF